MEKEFIGKFMAKNKGKLYKTDCKIILNDDKISLYFNGRKREYKADCIFSYEEEKLIKISENKNIFLETLLSFFGAFALFSNLFFGALVILFAFLRAVSKGKKSYILLLNPVNKPVLQLIKCRETNSLRRAENNKKAA